MEEKEKPEEIPIFLDADSLVQTANFIAGAIAGGLISLYTQRIHDWLLNQLKLRGRAATEKLLEQLEKNILIELKKAERAPGVKGADLELQARDLLRGFKLD